MAEEELAVRDTTDGLQVSGHDLEQAEASSIRVVEPPVVDERGRECPSTAGDLLSKFNDVARARLAGRQNACERVLVARYRLVSTHDSALGLCGHSPTGRIRPEEIKGGEPRQSARRSIGAVL
jgi:hypothetical protein